MFRQIVGAPAQFNSVLFGGFLGSIFSFLQFLASPVVGGLSDRFGRKPLLILTTIGRLQYTIAIVNIVVAGISLSYLLWVFSTTFPLFILARIIGGISKGSVCCKFTSR